MELINDTEATGKWGISSSRIHTFCGESRIEGATYQSIAWAIPKEAEKPVCFL